MQDIIQPKTSLSNSDSMAIDSEIQTLKISDVIAQAMPESKKRLSFRCRLFAFRWVSTICNCFSSGEIQKSNIPSDNNSYLNLLTPQVVKVKNKKILVLDLDETLVHSTFQKPLYYDIHLQININSCNSEVYVLKRPGVDEFIQRMAEIYEIVIFTASVDNVFFT